MDPFGNKIYKYFPMEDDYGCIEYKWRLINTSMEKKMAVENQMRWRAFEADNESAIYILGVHDNGSLTGILKEELIKSYIFLLDCASNNNFNIYILKLAQI